MANNNALTLYQEMAFGELTTQDVTTLRETIAKDLNEPQFKLFMAIAKASSANPFLKEIHPSVFGGQLVPQFDISFYTKKAREAEGYAGHDVQLVYENDTFKMHQERAEDGRYFVVIDEHSWSFPRGKTIGGYAIAYKEGFKPFTVVMDISEVEHYQKSSIGMQKTMWTNQLPDMFKKHMLKRTFKAAFGLNFDDEAENRSYDVPEYSRERKDITAEVNAAVEQQKQQSEPYPEPAPEESEAAKKEKARADMKEKFAALGITDHDEMAKYIADNAKPKGEKPTLSELLGLLKIMDMHIEQKKAAKSDDELLGGE